MEYEEKQAAEKKQLDVLNTADETAKKRVLENLKNEKNSDFNMIIDSTNNDVDQFKKTILFSLDQIQKILHEQLKCTIGSYGIFKRKCKVEEVDEINHFEARIRPVKKQVVGDFLRLKSQIASKPTLFASELNKIINNVNDSNKTELHNDIQLLIQKHIGEIPSQLTNLSEKYNVIIEQLTTDIFTASPFSPNTLSGGKKTRKFHRQKRNKKVPRRQKGTYKRG
jgi:hypothetical protein